MQRQHHGSRPRTSSCQNIGLIEYRKCAGYGQDHGDKKHLPHLGNRDIEEPFNLACAVYLGRLVQVLGDLLDRHDKEHGHITGALPLRYGDDGKHGRLLASQPDPGQTGKSDDLQKAVEQTDLRIVDKLKQQADYGHGDHGRHKIDASQNRGQFPESHVLKNGRQHKPEAYLDHYGNQRIQNVVFQTGQNDLV